MYIHYNHEYEYGGVIAMKQSEEKPKLKIISTALMLPTEKEKWS
jgi:hypothetical protein